MTTTLYKRIRKRGYLMVGYSLLMALGRAGLVLERILTEYNYAVRNNLTSDSGYFGYYESEIAYYISLAEDEVIEDIEDLAKKGLLDTIETKNGHKLIKVNEDEIYNFERLAEINNNYKVWDAYLYKIQYDVIGNNKKGRLPLSYFHINFFTVHSKKQKSLSYSDLCF